jgi:hypothetical protein
MSIRHERKVSIEECWKIHVGHVLASREPARALHFLRVAVSLGIGRLCALPPYQAEEALILIIVPPQLGFHAWRRSLPTAHAGMRERDNTPCVRAARDSDLDLDDIADQNPRRVENARNHFVVPVRQALLLPDAFGDELGHVEDLDLELV